MFKVVPRSFISKSIKVWSKLNKTVIIRYTLIQKEQSHRFEECYSQFVIEFFSVIFEIYRMAEDYKINQPIFNDANGKSS